MKVRYDGVTRGNKLIPNRKTSWNDRLQTLFKLNRYVTLVLNAVINNS